MTKFITKAELKGYDFSNFWNEDLFNELNEKDPEGFNGRRLSTWYLIMHHEGKSRDAITDMIWCLTINYFSKHSSTYKKGHMAELSLNEVATYVAEKFNTWSGEIIRWMKGMAYGDHRYDMDVQDRWGLDNLIIYVNK